MTQPWNLFSRDGVNTYEKERATILAEMGYVAFAADIYGSDLQEGLDQATKGQQATLYRSDPALFSQRIEAAMQLVKAHEHVDADNVAVIGYCFGGTGVLFHAFAGMDFKAGVAFHGGLNGFLPDPTVDIIPYVMVESGGMDGAFGNQTEIETKMNGANANWEITRYANVQHAFTVWEDDRYNLVADARSWEAMMAMFADHMPTPTPSSNEAPTDAPTSPNTDETPADAPTSSTTTIRQFSFLVLLVFSLSLL